MRSCRPSVEIVILTDETRPALVGSVRAYLGPAVGGDPAHDGGNPIQPICPPAPTLAIARSDGYPPDDRPTVLAMMRGAAN